MVILICWSLIIRKQRLTIGCVWKLISFATHSYPDKWLMWDTHSELSIVFDDDACSRDGGGRGGFSDVATGATSRGHQVGSLSRTLVCRWSRGNQTPGGYQFPTGVSWCVSRIVDLGWFGVFEKLQWHRWPARLTCRLPEIRAAWGECSLALGGPWCSP